MERVAFITGAARGIGAACAYTLVKHGFRLVVHARQQVALDKFLEGLPSNIEGSSILPLIYNMEDFAAIGQAFQRVFHHFRRLDVLVNNAGIMRPVSLGMMSRQIFSQTLDINLTAAVLHMQGAAKLMARTGGGSIINMSSIVGCFGFEGQVPYAASKAGLVGATLSAAKELATHQIRVNAVAPGYIDTDLHDLSNLELHQKNLARVRMGRMGTAQEVADLVGFLASDQSTYITGQVIGIDGGMSL